MPFPPGINIDPLSQGYAYGTDPSQPIGGLPAGIESKSNIDYHRRLAAQLKRDAGSTAPLGSWTQVVAQILGGARSSLEENRANAADQARTAALVKALGGNLTPNELQNLGVTMEDPSLITVAGQRIADTNRQSELDRQAARDAATQKQQDLANALAERKFAFEQSQAGQMTPYQQEQLKLAQDRFAFDKTKGPGGIGAGATLMNSRAIATGAQAPWATLSQGGTPDNPVPIIDSLKEGWSTIGQIAGEAGSKYFGPTTGRVLQTNAMSPAAQKAFSSLQNLTQLYIYTLSGKQANDPEVQRLMNAAMPVAGEDSTTTAMKKQQIAGMYKTILEKAQNPNQQFVDQSAIQLPDVTGAGSPAPGTDNASPVPSSQPQEEVYDANGNRIN